MHVMLVALAACDNTGCGAGCEDGLMADHGGPCVICRDASPKEVIAESAYCWVTAPAAAPLPGYVCVVSKTHVTEPFDLPPDQQAAFWLDVCRTARAVRDTAAAQKINYEIHGNTITHLHLHVFPRYTGDPFTGGPIDGSIRRFHRSQHELEQAAQAVQRELDR
jgi:diadenosine tetraphosphate (Ap4A) HIT family hydrolase